MLLVVAITIAACTRPEAQSTAMTATPPTNGWHTGTALRFKPHYGDSARRYDLRLDVRHTTSYAYRDLHLLVDIISDSGNVSRRVVNLNVADDYGNWTGSGFGTLYQHSVILANDVPPERASTIAIWQTMDSVKSLTGIDALGVVAVPSND